MNSEEDKRIIEASRMPLLSHVLELRRRLLWSLASICILFILCYSFAAEIFQFLARPLVLAGQQNVQFISTAPQEIFFTYIKISLWASLCLALPIILSQIWLFIAPGLYKKEQKVILPYLIATPLLFISGAALVYFGVLPLALDFFWSFEIPSGQGLIPISNTPRIGEYLSLAMSLMFAFGLCFQLPVLLTLLARVGMIKAESLSSKRRIVIVILFIVAAILTPPDIISQVSLALPLLLLYEASIFLVRIIQKEKGAKDTQEA